MACSEIDVGQGMESSFVIHCARLIPWKFSTGRNFFMTTGALSMGSDIGRCTGDHRGSKISPNYNLTQVFSAGLAKMTSMLAFFLSPKARQQDIQIQYNTTPTKPPTTAHCCLQFDRFLNDNIPLWKAMERPGDPS